MRKEEPDGFIVHALYHKRLLDLDDETLGTVFRNLILFYNGKDLVPETEGAGMLTSILCDHIEKDVNAYVERCRINRENIKKRYEKLGQNSDDTNDTTVYDCIRPYTNDANDTNDTAVPMDTNRTYIMYSNVKEGNVKESNVKEDNVNIYINNKDIKEGCALQADAPASLMPYTFLLKDGTYHRITESDFKNLQEAFPNVNLDTEFKKMVLWCSDPANAQKRKTKKGIMKFIRSWLSHTEKPVVIQKPEPANRLHEERRYDFDELERILTGRG